MTFEYDYLGLLFNYNGKFTKVKTKLAEVANKAMYALLRKVRFNLPVDMSLELFDKLAVLILLYGNEVWRYEQNYDVEKVHLKFCKLFLKLKMSTTNVMLYGKLGRFPLAATIKTLMISYLANIVSSNSNKLNRMLYTLIFELHEENVFSSQ